MDIIANNVANVETTRTETGGPFKRQVVKFRPLVQNDFEALLASVRGDQLLSEGVEVREVITDDTPGRKLFDPSHPDADTNGFVTYPNVDIIVEIADMMSATRSYEANVTVFNATKSMVLRSLDIGRA
jgi:flagellar basal-body rod protein FlgC